jgi:DNA repair protein RadD
MTIQVRDCQLDVITATRKHLAKGHKRAILQGATGFGKTRSSAWIIDSAVNRKKVALFLVSGRTLVSQAHASFTELGLDAAIIMAGNAYRQSAPVQVGSVHTVYSRLERLKEWLKPDLIITDECHESDTEMFNAIREAWPNAYEVGLTATPKPSEVYTAMAQGPSYQWLIDQGYLVQPRYYSVKESDSELLRVANGEFTERSQEAAFQRITLVGGIVTHWQTFAKGRPTVVFGPSVEVSRKNAELFNEAGISAFHIDAETPQDERQAAFDAVANGELQIICNYGVLSRGFDCPAISCVMVEREMRGITGWIQAVGRGLRSYPGKTDCIVIDLGENVWRHGCFVREPVEWTLDGKREPEKERKERLEAKEKKDVTCRECKLVYPAAPECPGCGYKPTKQEREAEMGERRKVELAEVKPKARAKKEYTDDDKRR